MNDQDFQKIRSVIKEEVRTIVKEEVTVVVAEQLKPIKATLDKHTKILGEHTKKLGVLDEHTKKIDGLISDVHTLQEQVGAAFDKASLHADRNKREINEIKDHLGLEKLSPLSETL